VADETFSISNTTQSAPLISSAVFRSMKDAVLGKHYNLSVVFIGDMRARKLNRQFRDKDYPTDILSFPISKEMGEIFMNVRVARQKAKLHERSEKNYLQFLFIHGLVHLKGMDHGRIMDQEEKKFRKKFNV
jgi:probable rRNA maturation factor